MDEATSGQSWTDWFQDVSKSVIGGAVEAKYKQPYDLQRLQLQALGQNGYYVEGQPGVISNRAQTVGGIPTGMLILGGVALLAVVLLKA